ncbi:hypothetical protein [Avibacterium endocarditidis]|uniref:hypothetical protein n=1 Tax=Avibacterium endocarditidis TaxID=380674 RepID=UPI0011B3B275|nr:hypothetical protein [Avibacterium endocarditidis]
MLIKNPHFVMRVFCDPVFNALTRPIHRNGNNGGGHNNCHCALHCCDFPNKNNGVRNTEIFTPCQTENE